MEAVRTSETSADKHFTRQYVPEDNSDHHRHIMSVATFVARGYSHAINELEGDQLCMQFANNPSPWKLTTSTAGKVEICAKSFKNEIYFTSVAILSRNLRVETKVKSHRPTFSHRIASLWAQIRTRNLHNSKEYLVLGCASSVDRIFLSSPFCVVNTVMSYPY
jgi:hypothetical protein